MLHESMVVVDIPNVKLLKKKFKKFHENLSKFCYENCCGCSTSFFTIPFESSDLCENTRTCLDPQLKNYG